jgi:hypothetical protein
MFVATQPRSDEECAGVRDIQLSSIVARAWSRMYDSALVTMPVAWLLKSR